MDFYPSSNRRVVITGMGVVSHYGVGIASLMEGLHKPPKEPEIVNVETFKNKYSQYPAYMVPLNVNEEFLDSVPNNLYRSLTPMGSYACIATDEAISLKYKESFHNSSNIGVAVGSDSPSMGTFDELFHLLHSNPKKVTTGHTFKTLNSTTALNVAKYIAADGRVISPSNACATALHTMILGYEAITLGKSNIMVCGGTEEYHTHLTFTFNKLSIASKKGCRPFQEGRDGILISDGAGIVILEDFEHAIKRNVPIYAEVLGSGMAFTAASAFSDTDDIIKCMNQAFDRNMNIDATLVINAHATGTPIGDENEFLAIQELKRQYPKLKIIVTALKEHLGHALAASGGIETVAMINLIKTNSLIPIAINEERLISELCNQDYTIDTTKPVYFLKNSFGLGGTSSSLFMKIY